MIPKSGHRFSVRNCEKTNR